MANCVVSSLRFEAFLVEDHLLIYDKTENISELVNQTGALLFLILENAPRKLQGLLADVRIVAPELVLDPEQLLSFVNSWKEREWVEENSQGTLTLSEKVISTPTSSKPLYTQTQTAPAVMSPHVASIWVSLDGHTPLQIDFFETNHNSFCPEAISRLRAVLSGVEIVQPGFSVASIRFEVTQDEVFIVDTLGYYRIVDESYALSILATLILRASYANKGMLLSAHAASIEKKGKQILLPANSGSGKSTLTASLIKRGWRYYGDDVVALAKHEKGMQTLPFRTAIGLKPGAWPLMQDAYPELSNLSVTEYAGKQAKFLPVLSDRDLPSVETHIELIVVPRFQSGLKPNLTRLSYRQMVSLFLQSGVSFMATDNNKKESLVKWLDWLSELPCYEMTYNNTESAALMLEKLI